MFPYDLATGEFGPAPEGVEGPRRRNARAAGTALVVSFGDAFPPGSFLRSGGLMTCADACGHAEPDTVRALLAFYVPAGLTDRHAGDWWELTYARLPCSRARMASQKVSEHVEHVDNPHLTAHRTLPLVGERTRRNVQGRVAVPSSLPLDIERTALVRSGPSGSASGTFRGEWQCNSHCHSVVSALGGMPYTATRHRACWAAHRTLPLGGERTGRHVQGRVAVRPVRSGASGSATHTATRW